jgi:arginyl-tRNA--protein-N-Asp/Glu arginylyltransferase
LWPDDEGAACPLAVSPTGDGNGRLVAVFVQHWISNDVILAFSYFRPDFKTLNVLWRLSLCAALIFIFRAF